MFGAFILLKFLGLNSFADILNYKDFVKVYTYAGATLGVFYELCFICVAIEDRV